MPVTYQTVVNEYSGNNSTKVFSYTFYVLSEDQIAVYLDGVSQSAGYTVADVGNPAGGTVTFNVAPGSGVAVKIVRETDVIRSTDFIEGGSLGAETLDDDQDYQTMIIQELDQGVMKIDNATGEWDAGGNRIINVGDPVNNQDAVTKSWANTAATSTLAAALAAQAAAEAAQAAAELAETNAETAETNAETAETNAGVSETNAAASAAAALVSEGNAATSESNASDSALEAYHWAQYAEDSLVPEGNLVDEYSAYHWAQKAAAAISLTGLSDTDITTPSDDDILQYNSTSGKWENVPIADTFVPISGNVSAPMTGDLYTQNIVPSADDTYDLGTSTVGFEYLYTRIVAVPGAARDEILRLQSTTSGSAGANIWLYGDNYPTSSAGDIVFRSDGSVIGRYDKSATTWNFDGILTSNGAAVLSAANHSIVDAAGRYTSTDVEGALQEVYSITEVDSALAGKSDVGHNHDARYYTEGEVDGLLGAYSTTVALLAGELDSRYYTESEVDALLGAQDELTELSDVSIPSPSEGDFLYFDGSVWTSQAGDPRIASSIYPPTTPPTVANGATLSIGQSASADGAAAQAIGTGATAAGAGALAIGQGGASGESAVGITANTIGDFSVGIGGATIVGPSGSGSASDYAIAIGDVNVGNATYEGDYGVAIGGRVSAGARSVRIGSTPVGQLAETNYASDFVRIGSYGFANTGSTSIGPYIQTGTYATGIGYSSSGGHGVPGYEVHIGYFDATSNQNYFVLKDKGQLHLFGNEAMFIAPSYATGSLPTGVEGGITYDTTTNELKYYNGADWTAVGSGGGGGTPAGNTTEVQFNDGGVFGASTAFTYNKAVKRVNTLGHNSGFQVNLAADNEIAGYYFYNQGSSIGSLKMYGPTTLDKTILEETTGNGIELKANNGNITLNPSASGNVVIDGHTFPNADGTSGQVLTTNGSGTLSWTTVSGGGSSDHGALTGLADDDHTQYHTDARGDARYYTQAQVDALLDDGVVT